MAEAKRDTAKADSTRSRRSDPTKNKDFREQIADAAAAAGKTASDTYGAAKALVPGVMLRQGLERAKEALKKITRR